jgi:hypothetical protein
MLLYRLLEPLYDYKAGLVPPSTDLGRYNPGISEDTYS